ncbi:GGDEF domain-containing protein, partial [Aliiglaciecola sp.]|nr:GGDEF domain-containing protein [Aliiglaciecola sp.]
MLLRQKANFFVLSTALIVASFTYLASSWVLENFLVGSDTLQKTAMVESIKLDVEVFERILRLAEEQWEEQLRTALPLIAEQLQNIDPSNMSEQLPILVRQHGLSDLHLINPDLLVYESTFKQEIGLDMSQVTDEYTDMLKGLFKHEKFTTHGVSLSTLNGNPKKYGYFSLADSDIIVNGDIDVRSRLERADTGQLADYLFGDYVTKLTTKYQWIKQIDMFIVSNVDQWSLFFPGKHIDVELARKLYNAESGDTNLFSEQLFPIQLATYNSLGLKVFLFVDFDNTLLLKTKDKLQIASLFIALLTVIFSYAILNFGVRKVLIERFSLLLAQIKNKQTTHAQNIVIEGNDEVSQLGEAINEMMGRIKIQEQRNIELIDISQHDGLTGVSNRRAFDERIELEWRQARRQENDFSVIMLDVDFFKDFNDNYGHVAGDDCLRKIATCLKSKLSRPIDFIARYGGEEFICILPNTDSTGAQKVSEDIRTKIESLNIIHDFTNASQVVTVSVGCYTINGQFNINVEEIIKSVDHLLYQAKDQGRNC